jgi:non-lysosomal glucosylceramidase
MRKKTGIGRRDFFKQAAGVLGAATQAPHWAALTETSSAARDLPSEQRPTNSSAKIRFPRIFTGAELKMLAFPLGGVAAGSIALGGRGQLRDWEIFNRPNQGFSPSYAFPAIWVQSGDSNPVARVLEARILPPYQGQDGL